MGKGSSETKRGLKDAKNKLAQAQRGFTRTKAENALLAGEDATDERFTKHPNYHVRLLAWKKQGGAIPEDKSALAALLETLSKGRSPAGKEKTKALLGMVEA